ncbi:MAG: hypothetical protein KA275_07955 [Chitinophagaceae bacterium]|nr:hypothetical protein [Chitinophagaceae bacterium]
MYKLTFTLKQHTPIIHFQHDQAGATLRASEVKPKLDKFIIEQCKLTEIITVDNKPKEVPKEEFKNYFINEGKQHLALDYKMRVEGIGENKYKGLLDLKAKTIKLENGNLKETLDTSITIPTYFGNLMKLNEFKDGKPFKKVSYFDTVTLIIFTSNEKLRDNINSCIDNFFFLNNFGTRQSKGFGSFTNMNNENKVSIPYLAFNIDKNQENPFEIVFNVINYYHPRLKSGVNYSFQKKVAPPKKNPPRFCHYQEAYIKIYLREKKMDYIWDKKWLKEIFFPLTPSAENKKLVRAFLGLSYDFKFGTNINPCNPIGVLPKSKIEISLNLEKNEIERIKSPITYKPIKVKDEWRIYILVKDIHIKENNNLITDHEFEFKFQQSNGKLNTPKELIDYHDLINKYNLNLTKSFKAFFFNGKYIDVSINI